MEVRFLVVVAGVPLLTLAASGMENDSLDSLASCHGAGALVELHEIIEGAGRLPNHVAGVLLILADMLLFFVLAGLILIGWCWIF